MPLVVGSLVWEKWRSEWYMGQVVAVEEETSAGNGCEDEAVRSHVINRVKIHVHGEPEPRDKWYDTSSDNIIELVPISAKESAVGVFPRVGDNVELLVVDERLARAPGSDLLPLKGTVLRVHPARDTSMVDVEYPTLPHDLMSPSDRQMRVCISNGYHHDVELVTDGRTLHSRARFSSATSTAFGAADFLAMVWKGLVDSPPDQSETLRRLQEIEAILHVCRDGSDWEVALAADHDAILHELWELLLDVVCSPLWLRIRAAELLNVCFTLRSEYLRIDRSQAMWLRSIVSSSCQILDELDPRARVQATDLFHWMAFLEHLLFATRDSQLFRLAVFQHATYASLLGKMVKLLGASSTQLFAATIICLAAFHRHEMQALECVALDDVAPRTSVLLDVVLNDTADRAGAEHVGGALLHVINSCGYPCPEYRLSSLQDAIQLYVDILLHDKVSKVIYINDFKVLMDILLRECTDLPLEDSMRASYLVLLDVALASPLYLESQTYRKSEVLKVLEELLVSGTVEDSLVPGEVTNLVNRILLDRIDCLD